MVRNVSLVFICVVMLSSALMHAAGKNDETSSLTIVVMDPGNAVISKAQVSLSRLPKYSPVKLEADNDGTVTVKLAPGEYDLLVTARSFASSKKHVQVNQSEHKKITIILQVARGGGVEVLPASPSPR
jgi:hypothetical protein